MEIMNPRTVNGGREKSRGITEDQITNGDEDDGILCFNCNHGRYLNGGVCPHVNSTTVGDMALQEGKKNPTLL